ncbi:glycosyltransferase family 2 protein [Psychrobacillus sp.]|uniref:glycosyltransferase family 2 protein n=1 Tax=Psychrobacillus sp. TaxID=1871623 RepID=UPI0028BD2E6A|nr:glycosyltransferase family 2 protein [Psychrobacillus sp.]
MSEIISVIVPIYKVEDYLNRCVDSILKQTYKNLEVILIDDGSPDKCGEICDEYAKIDERVKVIHKRNGGISNARNAGLEIAKGEYISFIDGDDWIHVEYFEKLYQLLRKTDSDISVCCFIKTSTEDTQGENSKEIIYEYSNIDALGQFSDRFNVEMVVVWGKLFKRKLLEEIRFPVERVHEDEFTTYKLIYKAKKIVLTTEQLLYYWQRKDSFMGVGFKIKHRLDAIDAFKERAEFFEEIGLEDLSYKTYRQLFFIYMDVKKRKNVFESELMKDNFDRNFKGLRENLRKNKKNTKFRMFYELYYIQPKIMSLFLEVYGKVRGI